MNKQATQHSIALETAIDGKIKMRNRFIEAGNTERAEYLSRSIAKLMAELEQVTGKPQFWS
jgi:hypothetical protein